MQTIISDREIESVVLCNAEDLSAGESKRFEIAGRPPIALFNINGLFYATDDTCTHATASLSEGDIDNDIVICPVHWAEFHIPSGKALTFPATCPLNTYCVEVCEGEVRINFKK